FSCRLVEERCLGLSDILASEAWGADFRRASCSSSKSIFNASSSAWKAVSSTDSLVVFFAMRLRLATYSPGHFLQVTPPIDLPGNHACRDLLCLHDLENPVPLTSMAFLQTDDKESLPARHWRRRERTPAIPTVM